MYMKMTDRSRATRKLTSVSCIVFARPKNSIRYSAGRSILSTIFRICSVADPSGSPSRLAVIVTWRWRVARSIWAGPISGESVATSRIRTFPSFVEGTGRFATSGMEDRYGRSARSHTSYWSAPSRYFPTFSPPTKTLSDEATFCTWTPWSDAFFRST